MRRSIIQNAPQDLINALCECIYNLLKGNVNLNESEKQKLSSYKKAMRKILNRISLKERKKILIQKGGFLEILLPSVISGLASIISSVITKE
jgi:hypothetical protein